VGGRDRAEAEAVGAVVEVAAIAGGK